MPLQNRVNPFGEIFAGAGRGTWMGNRGLIHKDKKIVKPFRLMNWITCLLQYRGVRRNVMTNGLYTELFFLDEATSFSAGHRPCAECRRADYTRFKNLWLEANKGFYKLPGLSIKYIDQVNHAERIGPSGEKIGYAERLSNLPNGVFLQQEAGTDCYLHFNGRLLKWTEFGYTDMMHLPPGTSVRVLTPKSYVRTFKQGYVPGVHDSAKVLLEG